MWMLWIMAKSNALIRQQKVTTVFALEQLSKICYALSVCSNCECYDEQKLKFFVKFFDALSFVDIGLENEIICRLYLDIVCAMDTWKDQLNETTKHKMIDFILQCVEQFVTTQTGIDYITNDPNIASMLLHTLKTVKNKQEQIGVYADKIMKSLRESEAEITDECAFEIISALDGFSLDNQFDDNLRQTVEKMIGIFIGVSQKYVD